MLAWNFSRMLAAVTVFGVWALGGQAAAQVLAAYWTDTPPTLDGDVADPCWREAPATSGFVLLDSNSPAKHQAEARVCYDAENLYVLLRAAGPAFTKEELDTSASDSLGFVLAQPHKNVDCFRFATDPLARRSDDRAPGGPDRFDVLEARTARAADGWSAEMRVPFHELGSWYANLGATPSVGAVWGILFFREHGRVKETSTWPTAKSGYRERRELGEIVFKGRRSGAQVPSFTMGLPDSDSAFVEILADTQEPLRCEYAQVRRQELLDKGERTFQGALRLPWAHLPQRGFLQRLSALRPHPPGGDGWSSTATSS